MLKRISLLGAAILTLAVLVPVGMVAASPVMCPDGQFYDRWNQTCVISITSPTTPGGAAPNTQPGGAADSGGAVSACSFSGRAIPCEMGGGYWSSEHLCYVGLSDPQPPKSDPFWQGHTDGAIYKCQVGVGGVRGPFALFWSASAPAGPAAPVDPAVTARTIVAQMELRAITIGMVPQEGPDSMGVVGLPVWMWVDAPSAQTFGPMTRSASLGGVTVTATARVSKVWWEMGDGGAVTCVTSGTPFTDGHGGQSSPDCGYTYVRQGTYTVRATSFWSVVWTSSTGVSGSIPLQFSRSRIVRIGEVQVVRR